jgi:23S rRNA pseudouridine1911/1915/1917 synthase
MGYEIKIYENANNDKIIPLLTSWLEISERRAKRLVDKGRVKQNGQIVERKGDRVSGAIEALVFKPTIDYDIKPTFDSLDFAIFNKPSGMLSHPNGFNSPPSILDHAKAIFGMDANITHRLDALTSGLIIVAKHKKAEIEFKNMFMDGLIRKKYIALLLKKPITGMHFSSKKCYI